MTNRYHSGKFCPFSKMNCRSDCVSLVSSNFCLLIDGNFSLSRRIEDLLAEICFEREHFEMDQLGTIS